MKPIGTPRLGEVVKRAFVVAHREDTSQLEAAMAAEGLNCEIVRGPYTDQQLTYPAQIRCLINHANAWNRITRLGGYAIVVEADFVPCRGMTDLPLPFEPSAVEKSMAWLYSVGPVIYHVDPIKHAMWGHNAGTVAYVVNDVVARDLVALYDEEMSRESQVYRSWEVTIPIKLRRERGVKCYIPWRMYGEHGGIANPEHKKSRMRAWHEADVLAGPLHFLPAYARGSKALFLVRRLRGRARGFYRFFAGKYFDRWTAWWRAKENRLLKLRLAVSRLI